MRGDQWKLAGVLLATALSIWYLYPSVRYYSLSPAQRQALPATELAKLRKQAIHLGLDLQGGMHLTLEVDKSRLNTEEAKDAVDNVPSTIKEGVSKAEAEEIKKKLEEQGATVELK